MATEYHRRTSEQSAYLGNQLIEEKVCPNLGPADDGKFVAVDLETGEYEVDEDDYTAVMRLRARKRDADIWLARIGQPAACIMRSAG